MNIKQKIKFNVGEDINLKLGLSKNVNTSLGRQESDYENLIKQESENAINPIVDNDVVRFRYGNSNHSIRIQPIGDFNVRDIINKIPPVMNSFYVIDFYDEPNIFKKNKITTNYLQGAGVVGAGNSLDGLYFFNKQRDLNYIKIPLWYLNNVDNNVFSLWFTINFYSAKTGVLTPYINQYYVDGSFFVGDWSLTNETIERMLFKVNVNKNNRSWVCDSATMFQDGNHVSAHYFNQNTVIYMQKLNSSIETTNIKKPDTPSGRNFNYGNRTYS